MKRSRWIFFLLIGWYVLLIVWHYFNQRPLWNDEQCIFLNIQQKTSYTLFHSVLLEFQQFPRTYLYAIQQFSSHFNFHLLALRFFPFVCMITAFFLWLRIAYTELGEGVFLLTFLACWCASVPLIYYAAELKQYSMDVLAGAVFVFLLRDEKKLNRWYWALPIFGLFSYPSFMFLVFPFYFLLRNKDWKKLALYVCICLAVSGFVYRFDLCVSNLGELQRGWNDHFISFDSCKAFFKTLGENFDNLISRWFVERPKWIRMVARFFVLIGLLQLILGAWKSFKDDKFKFYSVNSIAFVVLIEHLLLGVMHKYPFVVVRTSLFFAPMLLLMLVKGLSWLKNKQNLSYMFIHYSFLLYLGYVSLGIARVIFAGNLGAEPVIWR